MPLTANRIDCGDCLVEAEKAGLLNIGGQLQFLMPEGTCECYWVEVDALADEPKDLTWTERVALAATASRQKMADVSRRYDFIEEGRRAFTAPFQAYEAAGGDIRDRMECTQQLVLAPFCSLLDFLL